MEKTCYTQEISGGSRIYYIDACLDKNGQCYIKISDIPTKDSKKGRQRIYIYKEDVEKFADAFAKVSNYLKQQCNGPTTVLCNIV
ncbi:MAG: DUF3276 family protein [Muribaculaceae bacterium]